MSAEIGSSSPPTLKRMSSTDNGGWMCNTKEHRNKTPLQASVAASPRLLAARRSLTVPDLHAALRRLGLALAAAGRCGWLAGHLISISPARDRPAPSWRFRQSLARRSR
ncbi:unnamed protein product [Pleuronectes platessa]|uniref:Uncharacterized protein n=1 Tax=Pleuronectes platessa TaxID=8262 RepID=A0A9N7YKM3_PLEPL|nr:unnamed protein product [Pleuronectes platessa]